ncbi:hypothetical protein AADZ90_001235 [Aestuariibius sp. 2305UL40-4]|uniref:hypothetical protein n=1 Tax=Aestuariibius violaceus TaxID=3234132 RepID=UPI00345F124D
MSDMGDRIAPQLASARVTGTGFSRAIPVPERYRTEGYEAAFDAETLWYDAVAVGGQTLLICPKLGSLGRLVRAGQFTVDGRAVPVRRVRRYRRHDVVELAGSGLVVSLEADGQRFGSAVSRDETGLFAGMNAHVAITKDNDPVWIEDFARFHVQHHGLAGVLLFDNGSVRVPPEEAAAALARAGVRRAVVVPAPFPYGPRGKPPYARRTKFLQTALLNIARLRFLGRARAVLQCDIDELVWSQDARIFDMAAESRLGLVRFAGRWMTPEKGQAGPFRHRDHRFRRAKDPDCPTKYCIRPQSFFGRRSWDVHDLEGLPSVGSVSGAAGYLHCRGISTDWKGNARNRPVRGVPDAEAAALLDATDWA